MNRSAPARASSSPSYVSLTFDREMSTAEVERIKRSLGARTALQVPPAVSDAYDRAQQMGFTKSSRPEVGALMAVLAAAVPVGGRILELGTGAGVGLAWILHGLRRRRDVSVVSVEIDRERSESVSRAGWPGWVSLVVGDARDVIPGTGSHDLIFLDVPGGLKASVFDESITALNPGAQLLIDDMNPYWGKGQTPVPRDGSRPDELLEDPRLVCTLLQYSSGMILASRVRD